MLCLYIRLKVQKILLNFFEEAEEGYRKAFENGDIALDNFLFWSDVLYVLGEVNAAFEILNQAKELYPNEAEILYRLVGLFYNIEEETNAIDALETALTTDFNKNYILKDDKFFQIKGNKFSKNFCKYFPEYPKVTAKVEAKEFRYSYDYLPRIVNELNVDYNDAQRALKKSE